MRTLPPQSVRRKLYRPCDGTKPEVDRVKETEGAKHREHDTHEANAGSENQEPANTAKRRSDESGEDALKAPATVLVDVGCHERRGESPNDPKLSDSGPGARVEARRREAKARAVPGFMAGSTARD